MQNRGRVRFRRVKRGKPGFCSEISKRSGAARVKNFCIFFTSEYVKKYRLRFVPGECDEPLQETLRDQIAGSGLDWR